MAAAAPARNVRLFAAALVSRSAVMAYSRWLSLIPGEERAAFPPKALDSYGSPTGAQLA
jgi:hypothetical protein